MAQTLQHRRNTTTGLQTERGSEGEIFMDTTKKTLVVMDGVTNGGTPLAKEADIPTAVSELTNDVGYITSSSVFSGVYNDLTGKPTLFSGAYADLTGKPTLFSGAYADLTGKPTLFDGAFSSLSGIPTTLSGYGITDAFDGEFNSLLNSPFTYSSNEISVNTAVIDFGTDTTIDMQNCSVLLSGATVSDFRTDSLDVGNTHSISAADDYTMQFGPNDARIYFGTSIQNWYQVQNVEQIILSPNTAVSIAMPDENQWTFGLNGELQFPDGSTQTTAWLGSVSVVGDGTSYVYVPVANGNIVFSVNNEIPVAVVDEDGLIVNKIVSGAISGLDLTITTDYSSGTNQSGNILIDADDQGSVGGYLRIGSQSGRVSVGRVGGETDIYGEIEFNNGNTVFQSGQTLTVNTTGFYVNEIHGLTDDDLVLTGGASDGSVIINGDGTGQVQIDQVAGGGVWIGKTDGTGSDIQTYSRLQVHRGIIYPYQSKVNATGVVVHDCDDGHLFYHLNPAADWTVNLTNFRTFNTMSTTITLVVEQGVSAGYLPLSLQIEGSAQTIKWLNNSVPSGSVNKTDIVTFTIFDKGVGYNVLGEFKTYG
jgi:hypothetical protein